MFPCRLCGQSFPKLAESHIIPRSFYKSLKTQGGHVVLLSAGAEKVNERQHQSGIWDNKILCLGCEAKFSPYDAHGFQILKDVESYPKFENPPGTELAYLLQGVDYHKLKLFFLSMLLRAHWASHRFFNRVDVGPHEATLKDFIVRDYAPPPEEYSVFLYHLTGHPYPNVILPPWPHRVDHVNVTRFYLPGVVALITVDKRSLAGDWKHFRLNDQPPHKLVFFPFERSPEHRYFQDIQAEIRRAKHLPKKMT